MPPPPGVSEQDFARALNEFRRAVGDEWVFFSDEDVELYRDSYSPFMNEPEDPVPSAAVAPRTTEQVQECVRIANRYVLPLWVLSTGKNLGYGGSAPRLTGSVMIDLKRMDRILEISETNRYALVEPGVSYFDLYREIQSRGLKLWMNSSIVQGTLRLQSARTAFSAIDAAQAWSADLQFYGPVKVVDAQWEYAQDRIRARIPDAAFVDGPEYRFPLFAETLAGIENAVPLGILGLEASRSCATASASCRGSARRKSPMPSSMRS